VRESVAAAAGSGGIVPPDIVFGVLSLIIWTVIIVVTAK
jgi:K+ transporter